MSVDHSVQKITIWISLLSSVY